MKRSLSEFARMILCAGLFCAGFVLCSGLAVAQNQQSPRQDLQKAAKSVTDEPKAGAMPSRPTPEGYGWLLLRMVLVLGAVCLIAYVVLRWGVKRFVAADSTGKAMEVLARLPLEPKRSVVVVRVGSRHLILGSSEGGMRCLGELSSEEAAELVTENNRPGRSFREVLGREKKIVESSEGALEKENEGESESPDDTAAA